MTESQVYFVGTPAEVNHHAAPLKGDLDVVVIDAAEVVERAVAGDVAIFFSEHFDRFRQAVVNLKEKNVATIYMIDGILEWRNAWENDPDEIACPYAMRPVLAHKVACIGENQARVISGWGNANKTEIVGVPRFDCYGKESVNNRRGEAAPDHRLGGNEKLVPVNRVSSNEQLESRKPLGSADRFRVLVMTAKTPAFTDRQWATVKRSVMDCKNYFDQHVDQIDVTWRLTGGLDQYISVSNAASELTGVELRDQLEQVDAVISTPSTAVVEAMLVGRPTALLNYFDCPCYLNPAWRIGHRSQIDSVVEQLKQPTVAQMHFQQQQRDFVLYRESSATDRLVQLVRQIQASAAEQLAGGVEKIRFQPNLLPQPVSAMVEFNWRAMFSGEAGNDKTDGDSDLLQSEVQLAHARRQIDHLNKRIDELKSELGQAHQIFEQIHRHPIAGPIVRIRERLLGLLNSEKSDLQSDLPSVVQSNEANEGSQRKSAVGNRGGVITKGETGAGR